MATACLIALLLVGGWLVPIDPSFFHSSTRALILRLTTDLLDPFLSGMSYFPCGRRRRDGEVGRACGSGEHIGIAVIDVTVMRLVGSYRDDDVAQARIGR